jgi:peptidyl-lysine (3S)-dioxygenase / protease
VPAQQECVCTPRTAEAFHADAAPTNLHRVAVQDHYENLYAVVKGQKTFILRPPSSIAHMHLRSYPVWEQTFQPDFQGFRYSHKSKIGATGASGSVLWCPVDVDAISSGGERRAQQRALFPRYFQGPPPLEVVVNAGDVFYLPAMWYHYVRQNELDDEAVIAVNCWVDMRFDASYAYFDALKKICESVGLVGSL